MACTYTFKGKIYSETEFNQFLSDNPTLRNDYLGGNIDVVKTENIEDKLVSVKANNSSTIKEGVSEVFKSSPELANIGTQEQYSQYLNTIFPDSKVKDIVYHGGKKGIESFDKAKLLSGEGANVYGRGFYFTDNKETAVFSYEQLTSRQDPEMAVWLGRENLDEDRSTYPILLNIQNPFLWDISAEEAQELNLITNSNSYEKSTTKSELKNGNYGKHDSVLHITQGQKGLHKQGENHWIIPEPEQIHILGSKQDVEGFTNFVKDNNSQLAQFSSLGSIAEEKIFKKAHSFTQSRYADYGNRVKAFPNDRDTKDIVDVLTQLQVNTDLSIMELEDIVTALEKDYQYSRAKLNHPTNGIIAALTRYSAVDIKTLVDNEKERIAFTNSMRIMHTFLRTFSRISELPTSVDTTGWSDIAEQLNNVIRQHQTLAIDVATAQSLYDDLVTNFFMERNNSISTNPNIQQGIMDIFTATDDENVKQLWLDALADTNNSFIATTIKNYVRQTAKAETDTVEEMQRFRNAIMKAFHLTSLEDVSSLSEEAFYKYLEKDNVGRFTGRFVQQYSYDAYFEALKKFEENAKTYKGTSRYYNELNEWHRDNDVIDLTQEEIDEIIATKKRELSTFEFEAWRKSNFYVNRITQEITYKVSGELARPSDKYINQEWTDLQGDELFTYLMELLPKLIKPYTAYNIISQGYVPSRNKKEAKFDIKEYYERHLAKKPREFIGEGNEVIRMLTLEMVNKLDQQPTIPISEKFAHEVYDTYVMRVLMETENGGYGKFDSLDEIREHNAKIKEENKIRHGEAFDKNLYSTIGSFIKKANTYKYKKEIENEVTLALYKTEQLKFVQREYNGKMKVNKVANRLLNQGNKSAEITISDSNIKKHFNQWMEAIFYDNFDVDQGHLTAVSKILLKYVSAKNMWLNYSSGVNNVMYGTTQIKIEKAAAYFVNAKDLHEAEKDYWSNVANMFADIQSETSDNLLVALLKRFDIVEAQTEQEIGAKVAWKHLISVDSLYFMQEIGEHWMQNKMLIAMMKSHRVIDGKIKSFIDYKSDNRRELLESILTPRELNKLDIYIEQETDKNQYIDGKTNYIEEFLTKFVSIEKIKEYNTARKAKDEELRIEFEKYDTVQNSFELVNGIANVKKTRAGEVETPAFDINQLADFTQRVKKVNQSIHGIYNKDDASLIQRNAIGKLAIQFRKWMIPGWNKRFGSRFFKSYWNEGRQAWDKGAYQSALQFLGTPFFKNLNGDINDMETTGKAMGNILTSMFKFLRNFKLYYNVLDDFEKANVQRTFREMSYFAMTLAVGFLSTALMGMGDDDDDKDVNFATDFALYQWDRFASEMGFYTPFGVINEGKKIFTSPAAVTSALGDFLDVVGNSVMFVVDKDGRYYKSGMYSKELKLHVSTGKMIPVYNQWLKTKRIDKMNRYYNLFFF